LRLVLSGARSSVFDNWTWPVSLIPVAAITATWALGSALCRDARPNNCVKLRSMICDGFDSLLSKAKSNGRRSMSSHRRKSAILKAGAFAPLIDQPFIRAVLFPSAAVDLLTVGQRVLDIF